MSDTLSDTFARAGWRAEYLYFCGRADPYPCDPCRPGALCPACGFRAGHAPDCEAIRGAFRGDEVEVLCFASHPDGTETGYGVLEEGGIRHPLEEGWG